MRRQKFLPLSRRSIPRALAVSRSTSSSQERWKGRTAPMTQWVETNEATLISAILAGDSRLFHDLIRPHERSVYMIALAVVKNEADAEEVAQEAFLKAFRSLSRFRSESRFGTWLNSIALNEARARLRRRAIVPMESLDDASGERSSVSPALLRDWREIPSQVLERQEIREMLQEAVISLPDLYRQVFLLRDIEELSVAETAEALSISISLVKVRLHRARIMLQKHLSPRLKQAYPSRKRRWLSWS